MGAIGLGGLAAFVPGVVMLKRRIGTFRRGHMISGEIISWDEVKVSRPMTSQQQVKSRTVYRPTVRYTTLEGTTHKCAMDQPYPKEFCQENPVGAPHNLRYDPLAPERAYDPTWRAMFFVPSLFIFSGALMLLLALGMLSSS
jgi:hypothetical protein